MSLVTGTGKFVTWKKIMACVSLLGLTSQPLLAHERRYTFNQEYRTIPKGQFEIESHNYFKMPKFDRTNVNEFTFQEELEYGVTDRLTLAHYELWKVKNKIGPDDSTVYEGFKFETKYRLGEKGKYWVDPLLYLEWVTNPRNHKNPNKIESKIILSKDLGKFNLTYNQIMESVLGSGGRTDHQFTTGMNYEISESVHLGMEIKGDYWRPSSHRNRLALGPSISYAHNYFWIAATSLFGVNHAADDWEIRIIVGVPFEIP